VIGALRRGGASIFTRTFLLLAVALVLAQGVGVALLVTRTPIYEPPVRPPEVIALLTSRIPASSHGLRVSELNAVPAAPPDQIRDRFIEMVLARWLEVEREQVRFYRAAPEGGSDPNPSFPEMAVPPADLRRQSSEHDRRPPREIWPPWMAAQPNAAPNALPMQVPQGVDAAPPMRARFTAALQQPDGRWRVVQAADRSLSAAFKLQVGMLFAIGLLLMLPLAWWFSRALSAPIRRFATAADQLGRNPDAPPLPRTGPPELLQATDSFNTMQERLHRMVSERTHMVGAIAHDLRTPLARLAFRLDGLPSPLREKATADIEEMKTMITTALTFLRDQSQPGERERLDFGLLVESVVDDLADIGRDVRLVSCSAAMMHGDPVGLRRVVTNLVENALKFGQRARLQLICEAGHCLLQVDDDGPGIDPAQHDALFMPFFRGENSRNRDTGGIGLGLSAARAIVLAHGGTLGLQNREGGGLRAWVRLPWGEK
jgi:two-component system, OmpR family, sensor kinase